MCTFWTLRGDYRASRMKKCGCALSVKLLNYEESTEPAGWRKLSIHGAFPSSISSTFLLIDITSPIKMIAFILCDIHHQQCEIICILTFIVKCLICFLEFCASFKRRNHGPTVYGHIWCNLSNLGRRLKHRTVWMITAAAKATVWRQNYPQKRRKEEALTSFFLGSRNLEAIHVEPLATVRSAESRSKESR